MGGGERFSGLQVTHPKPSLNKLDSILGDESLPNQ